MENQSYKTELDSFEKAFQKYKNKKIALYGLGRRTATIVSTIKEYNFIGLLDRDSDNIGKTIYGIPVLSEEDAEKNADLIIINTAEAYWETIYNRISHLKTPVYFRNGQRAIVKDKDCNYKKLKYWKSSYAELKALANNYDVISFDIFDTLIMRKLLSPSDVFCLMDHKLNLKNEDFTHIRSAALAHFEGREYLLDELYIEMQKLADWSDQKTNYIKNMELEIEQSIVMPRNIMDELLLELQKSGKEIYLISDMYLPKTFVMKLLEKSGISIPEDHIIISGEIKLNKRDGGLWKYYANKLLKGRTALHIGDDKDADIENAQQEGIATYYVMSATEMLKKSSLSAVEPMICGVYESIIMGLICAKLFENPFQLNEKQGTVSFEEFEKLGYCWFGNVILTFLLWMLQESEKMNLEQLVFFARDGYFLLEDYENLIELNVVKNKYNGVYLPISRRLIMISAIEDEESFRDALIFPYCGSWTDYLQDRFDITILENDVHKDEFINASADEEKIRNWLEPYKTQLISKIEEEKNNYLKLVDSLKISEKAAVIDIGYYGNTQHYLNKLMDRDFPGLYFSADLSIDNICACENKMNACFQSQDDKKATSCNIHKQSLILESFLTAPYGMIKKIDSYGNWIVDINKKSQEHFEERIEMNEGVKLFMKEFCEIMAGTDLNKINLNAGFADILFGEWVKNGNSLSPEIKDSFYWDNGMVQRRESKIFE